MVGRASIWAVGVAGALLLLFALVAFSGAGDGRAAGVAPRCHAYSDALLPLPQAERRLAWTCKGNGLVDGPGVIWLRFEDWERPPRYLFAPPTGFHSVTIAAIDADGTARLRRYRPAEVELVAASQSLRLDLPAATETTRAYLVAFDRPTFPMLIRETRLDADPAGRRRRWC